MRTTIIMIALLSVSPLAADEYFDECKSNAMAFERECLGVSVKESAPSGSGEGPFIENSVGEVTRERGVFVGCGRTFRNVHGYCASAMQMGIVNYDEAEDDAAAEAARSDYKKALDLYNSMEVKARAWKLKPSRNRIDVAIIDETIGYADKDRERMALEMEAIIGMTRRGPVPTSTKRTAGDDDPVKKRTLRRNNDAARRREDALNRSEYPDAQSYEMIAGGYLRGENPADAERVLTKAIALDDGRPSAYSKRAMARVQGGDLDGAARDAEATLARDPDNTLAQEVAAYVRAAKRKKAALGGAFKKPDFKGFSIGLTSVRAGLGAGKGAGPAVGARKIPSDIDFTVVITPAQKILLRASRKLELGDREGALIAVTRAIDLAPEDPAGWALRARISNGLKNYEGAIADATKALSFDPKNAAALRERAIAHYESGNYQQAFEDADLAVKFEPGNATGYLYRGMALEKLGKVDPAMSDYAKAAELDPSLRPLYVSAGTRMGRKVSGSAVMKKDDVTRSDRRLIYIAVAMGLILFGGRKLWEHNSRKNTLRAETAGSAAPGATVPNGTILGGNFRVDGELGRGGMGVVYDGYDMTLDRRVAIKQMRMVGTDEDRQRFLQEARLVASLRHANLIQILSVIEEGFYLVFERVDGKSLADIMGGNGAMKWDEARGYLSQVCMGLSCAHRSRVIHRDLKPANILIDKNGEAKIMDFGLAHQSRTASKETQVDTWGTPAYMAPEQYRGKASKETDLYALAIMAYEMLTGQLPYRSGDLYSLKEERSFPQASSLNVDLPKTLDGFFSKALDPAAEKRFRSAEEFIEALDFAGRKTS